MSTDLNNALISCQTCGGKMSLRAPSCPHCGEPNILLIGAQQKAQSDSKQGAGCLLVVVGGLLCLFLPIIGIPLVIIGIAMLVIFQII